MSRAGYRPDWESGGLVAMLELGIAELLYRIWIPHRAELLVFNISELDRAIFPIRSRATGAASTPNASYSVFDCYEMVAFFLRAAVI